MQDSEVHTCSLDFSPQVQIPTSSCSTAAGVVSDVTPSFCSSPTRPSPCALPITIETAPAILPVTQDETSVHPEVSRSLMAQIRKPGSSTWEIQIFKCLHSPHVFSIDSGPSHCPLLPGSLQSALQDLSLPSPPPPAAPFSLHSSQITPVRTQVTYFHSLEELLSCSHKSPHSYIGL